MKYKLNEYELFRDLRARMNDLIFSDLSDYSQSLEIADIVKQYLQRYFSKQKGTYDVFIGKDLRTVFVLEISEYNIGGKSQRVEKTVLVSCIKTWSELTKLAYGRHSPYGKSPFWIESQMRRDKFSKMFYQYRRRGKNYVVICLYHEPRIVITFPKEVVFTKKDEIVDEVLGML